MNKVQWRQEAVLYNKSFNLFRWLTVNSIVDAVALCSSSCLNCVSIFVAIYCIMHYIPINSILITKEIIIFSISAKFEKKKVLDQQSQTLSQTFGHSPNFMHNDAQMLSYGHRLGHIWSIKVFTFTLTVDQISNQIKPMTSVSPK